MVQYIVSEEIDTRDNSPLWVVRLTEKVGREQFMEISEQMKQKKGFYSKFKKGFIFREQPTI